MKPKFRPRSKAKRVAIAKAGAAAYAASKQEPWTFQPLPALVRAQKWLEKVRAAK